MNAPLPPNNANLFDTAIFNAQVPREGPKALPLIVPFSSGTAFDVNLLLTQSQQFMSLVQAIFVDNSAGASPVTIMSSVVGQTLTFPPNSQGYLPFLCAKNSIITFLSECGVDTRVILLNVPVPAIIWNVDDAGGNQYVSVAAGSTQILGTEGGAIGDLLEGLLVIPGTTSPGAVTIADGAGSAITVFAGGASSVSTLIPFFVPINALSVLGPWTVTTGTDVTLLAYGNFT